VNTDLRNAKEVDAIKGDLSRMIALTGDVIAEAQRLQRALKAAIEGIDGTMRPIEAFREFLSKQVGPFHIQEARDYVYARVTNRPGTGTLNVMLFNAEKKGTVRRVTGREDPRRPGAGKFRTGWYEVVKEESTK